jgi:type IV secretory pathway VirB6-like protein
MKKALVPVIIIATIALIVISYKSLFTRVVNYEIAGIQIPSKYNILTGKVTPIQNYRGKSKLPVMQPAIKGNLGLSAEQADAAKLRWALFEEWVGQMPQYKDWESNQETFKQAMAEFRKFISGE